ncbi:hypothetical protein [Rheinheimera sp.]|uniref:hypothetical protein n=1 Tax=Rheinheimera sp. TaxID=1869214 RepID=UPI002FDCD633
MTLRVALNFTQRLFTSAQNAAAALFLQATPTASLWAKCLTKVPAQLAASWLLLLLPTAFAQQQSPDIPAELTPWQDWVLAAHPTHPCPWLAAPQAQQTQQCQWSESLVLETEQQGGRFVYQLQLFAEGWVSLPGDVRSWPQQVEASKVEQNKDGNKSAVALRDQDGVPQFYLSAGRWQIQGEFRWPQMPPRLSVPEQSGVISLKLFGTPVLQPKKLGTELWLQQPKADTEQSSDQLQIKVFRRLSDDIPARLTTTLQLEVSGKSREQRLDTLLLPGFFAEALYSDLPALMDDKGALHLQLSAGQYQLQLDAVSFQPVQQLQLPKAAAPLPAREIWAFVAQTELRTVDLTGVNSLDPNQTQVPADWQQYPLYTMDENSTLTLTQLQRGGGAASDQLRLTKRLWLDFSGETLTASDQISGSLYSQARLEVQPGYQLGRVALGGEAQLITQLPEREAGVEIRQNPINLHSISRIEAGPVLPVSGWQSSFSEVSWQLQLPPGWSLFTASGADRLQGTVLEQWTLWDIFFVLLFSVASARLLGWPVGLLALAALVLSYQRDDAPQWSWLSLLALLALLPLAKAKAETWLKKALYLNLLLVLLILLPFSVEQIRQAIYPQLERPYQQIQSQSSQYHEESAMAETAIAEAPAAQGAPAPQSDATVEARMDVAEVAKKAQRKLSSYSSSYAINAPAPLLQTDPNARVQTGPAEPDWHWQRVELFWQGPLLAEEQTRLYLVPAWLNRLGNLVTVLLLFVLLWQLCRPLTGGKLTQANIWVRLSAGLPGRAALVLSLVLPGALLMQPSPALATGFPDAQLLTELEQRLLQSPQCLPSCTSINQLVISDDPEHIKLQLQLDSQAETAWLLPVAANRLKLARLNQANAAIFQQAQQSWLYLPKGRHQLELWISPEESQLSLSFGSAWHQLDNQLKRWRLMPDSSDLNDLQSLEQARKQLRLEQLARDNNQNNSKTFSSGAVTQNVPAYAVLERQLSLGLEWQITSTLRRTGMSQQQLQLKIALLDGETPLTPLPVVDGALALQLNAEQQSISWQSSLKPIELLKLTSPSQQQYTEIWQLSAAPKWHIASEGLPAISTAQSPLPSLWRPWPGESLQLTISQPQPVEGEMLTIQQLMLQQHQGNRSSDIELKLQLNASQAQSFSLPLPKDTKLQSVSLDGVTLPLTVNQQQLTVQLKPGRQQLQLNFTNNMAQPVLLTTPGFSLPLAAANIYLQLQLAPDRWILAVGGPDIGPALLFWGMLAVMLLLAMVLPRLIQSPLRRRHWLLLFTGICTVSFWIPLLITLWLLAVSKRGQFNGTLQGTSEKLSQIALVLLSISALLALFSAIPYGLLSAPDMQLMGNGSYQQQLYWYQDLSSAQLPVAWVLSLPLWCYQLSMLLWSLWLATALTRWLPWVWQQLSAGGFWPAPTAAEQAPAQSGIRTDDEKPENTRQ